MSAPEDVNPRSEEATGPPPSASRQDDPRFARPGVAPIGHPDRLLCAKVDDLGEAALNLGACEDGPWRERRRATTVSFAQWLEQFPGGDWQARWTASGIEDLGTEWLTSAGLEPHSAPRAVATLMALRVVRPSYAWIGLTKPKGLTARFQEINDPAEFARIRGAADDWGLHRDALVLANLTLVRIMITTGKVMADITRDDFLSFAAPPEQILDFRLEVPS